MKVRVDKIPPEGLDLQFDDTGIQAGDLGEQVENIIDPPQASLNVTITDGGQVVARGEFKAVLELACSRCLARFVYEVTGPLNMVLSPQPQGEAGELELDENDMQFSFYQGDEIDLGRGLAGEIALSLPMAPLCSEDCTGLCTECGKPLSEGECGCGKKNTDPRWAKLAELDLK